jgi:hypothetical protein
LPIASRECAASQRKWPHQAALLAENEHLDGVTLDPRPPRLRSNVGNRAIETVSIPVPGKSD